jgi:predicted ribosomally synthesized peptide with SipW-like signal peptide
MMKIVKSAAVIVAATAVIASGTYAWYTDTESINGVTFSADTMALKIDSDPLSEKETWSNTFTSPYKLANLRPGNYGEQIINITNTHKDIEAHSKIKLVATGNEALVNSLQFTVSYKTEQATEFTPVASGPLSVWNNEVFRQLGELDGGKVGNVKIEWEVPGSIGNEIQGQSINLNIVFGLDQDQIREKVEPMAK